MEQEGIQTGQYQHYKGNRYEVLGVAEHSEANEKFVVYRALFDGYHMYVRPLEEFKAIVDVDGKKVERFQYVGN